MRIDPPSRGSYSCTSAVMPSGTCHVATASGSTSARNTCARGARTCCSTRVVGTSGLLDQLDAVVVGVAHESEQRATLAHRVRRLLGVDAQLGQLLERGVDVGRGDG